MRVSVSPMFNVSDDTLIARLVIVGDDGVVAVGVVGGELSPQATVTAVAMTPARNRPV